MGKSLRVRLQLWYGLVLVVIIAGFAALMYYRSRAAVFDAIDGELEAAVQYLDVNLRRFPLHEFVSAAAARPPEDEIDEAGWPRKGRKPPPRGEQKGPPPREDLLEELALPGRTAARTYFGVWREDGSMIKAADLPEGIEAPEKGLLSPHEPILLQRGEYREVAMPGPPGSRILVGRSVRRELAELRALAWRLGGVGIVVLAVGLAGGWIVSARILRPVAAISATAAGISATNLSERIDATAVDVELAEMARVLNATFDRLQAAFERQARFTADASHELRTPLAILRSHAELALARPRSSEEYRAALAASLSAAGRMTALVEGLLLLARADAGKLDGPPELVDLKHLVEDHLDLLRPLAKEKGVTLTATLASARIQGDALRLGQVVANLLTNAVQHNRAGGTVQVVLGLDSGSVSLAVSDTGPGIPEDQRGHVFERFFRADKARTRATGGTGLGLAICKTIVAAHGGTIDFESQPGRGCTFWVRLPMVPVTPGAR
jgi:heavy metal sensor kinase